MTAALTSFEVSDSDFAELSAFIATIFTSAGRDRVLRWFDHWWKENPNWNPSLPRGWILRDSGGTLVAFTANIPFRYVVAGGPALCLVTGTTAVHSAWRGKGISRLVGRLFAEQRGAELLVGVDSVPAALKTWQSLGFASLPLQWPRARAVIADPNTLLANAFSNTRVESLSNSVLGPALRKVLELSTQMRRHIRPPTTDVTRVEGFDDADNEALKDCRASSCATFAYRDARQLNWLYGRRSGGCRNTLVLVARRRATLVGFAGFKRSANHLLLLECRCRDLNTRVARDLLLAGRAIAADEHLSHVLIWPYSDMLRAAVPFGIPMRHRPMSYCFKSNTERLDIADWETTPGDGDISVV